MITKSEDANVSDEVVVEPTLKRVRAKPSGKFKTFSVLELKAMANTVYWLISKSGEEYKGTHWGSATSLNNLKKVADQWYSTYQDGSPNELGAATLPAEVLLKIEEMFKPKPRAKRPKKATGSTKPFMATTLLSVDVDGSDKAYPLSPLVTDDDIPF